MSDQEIRQAYIEGFAIKCAEYNVDPQVLAELVFEKDAQLGWMKRQAQGAMGAVGNAAGKAYDAVANSPVGLGARMVMAKKDRLGGNMAEGALNAATNVASAANTGTMALGGAIHSGIKGGINAAQTAGKAIGNAAQAGSNAVQQGYGQAVNTGMNALDKGLTGAMGVSGGIRNAVGMDGMTQRYQQGSQAAMAPQQPPQIQQVAQR